MPELPEVEAARRALEEHCVGKKIQKCTVADDSKVIHGVSSEDFEAALVGKTIVAAHRKGKNMWLELDSPPFPSFQFGMAGAVYIKGVAVTKYKRSAVKDTDEWPSKYSKLFVELADGLEFSFTDKRRFAKVRLLDNPVSVPPITELGPDALTDPMTVDEFYNSLNKKKIGIKTLLLDQSFISGIGNWMADEVLYQARIHPIQTSSSISKESCAILLKCINEVTNFAVEVDADSLRFPVEWLFHFRWGKKPGKVNAVEVGADSSQFPSNWIFHSREKKPGKAFIDGKTIEFIDAGGRTSAFVPELQKLPGNQAVKETGKRSKGKTAGKGRGVDESEDEDKPKKARPTKEKTSSARKPSSKKKSGASVEASDEDEDGDGADDESQSPKRKTGAKNPPAKRKSKGGKKDEPEMKKAGGKSGSSKRKQEGSDDDDDFSEDEDGKQVKAVAASKKKRNAN